MKAGETGSSRDPGRSNVVEVWVWVWVKVKVKVQVHADSPSRGRYAFHAKYYFLQIHSTEYRCHGSGIITYLLFCVLPTK